MRTPARLETATVFRIIFRFPPKFRPIFPQEAGADLLALAGLVGLIVLLFRQFLFGRSVFIGNPDRLNTYLNVLRFHSDGIRAGHLNAWSESLFGGMNSFGLAYTFPNPLTFLISLAPASHLFAAANLVSFSLLAASGWAAYAFMRRVGCVPRHAFVGAALYELCFLPILKMSQNDMTFAVLLLIPLLLRALHSVRPNQECRPFIILSVLLAGLMFLTFVQEAAYAILLAGAYALYRCRKEQSWAPIRVFAAAFLVASLAAAPRLYTIRQEMALTVRSTSEPWGISSIDLLRFASDAAFGRTSLHCWRLGNGVNQTEGMMLFVSCFAPLLLTAGALRYRGGWLRLLWCGGEAGFCFWAVVGCMVIVYSPPLFTLFHLLFLRLNFIHARLLTVAVLPLGALMAFLLCDLEGNRKPVQNWTWTVGLLAAPLLVVAIQWLAQAGDPNRKIDLNQSPANLLADVLRTLAYQTPEKAPRWYVPEPNPYGYHHLAAFGVRQFFWSVVVFAAVGLLLLHWRRMARPRSTLAGCLAGLMIGQTFAAIDYRVNGTHCSRAYTRQNCDTRDMLRASVGQFRVPSEAAVAVFGRRLETDRYRTVLLGPQNVLGIPASHLGLFWRLRLLEGYGSATPTRLSVLPFPVTALYGFRGIGYHRPDELDWRFLGFMNVKYAVAANPAFHRNAARSLDGGWREATPADVRILENPCPVVPRAFFAQRVRSADNPRAAVLALLGGQTRANRNALLPGPGKPEGSPQDIPDPQIKSVVEGEVSEREFAVEGRINPHFAGDRIDVEVEPSNRPRFLVLNERYHPGWSATVDGRPAPIYPTNVFMRGLIIPAGATRVVLRFQPWVCSAGAWAMYGLSLALFLVGAAYFHRRSKSPAPA